MKNDLDSKIDVLRENSLTSLAKVKLEHLIFNGMVLSGQKVKESVIASQLGFSRGPVREACQAMVSEGVFVSINQRGVFVRDFTEEEIKQLYQIRKHLGLLIGSLATQNASPDDVSLLADIRDKMRDAAAAEDRGNFFDLSQSFNTALLNLTRNDELKHIYTRLTKNIRIYRIKYLSFLEDVEIKEHWQSKSFNASVESRGRVIYGIQQNNSDLVGELLKRHALESEERTNELVALFKEKKNQEKVTT
ncbi:GntR family transcriptional regulator [Motiliproteus sp. MSK22-1]|uniref:GntR family transcriptional regulator n=1 Tax=Motiliproteus sp. MSK22-1 TaxID=1897630 RepID=UPI000975F0A3|nr:GntR family transcriptional regulator [Motiliproteus sp. MSK22-1]OMH27549.1 hypothetical protein BGP75_22520 [Motiliproteus sp. MSK22-1]